MAINFPSSPEKNEKFVDPETGVIYFWTGTHWRGGLTPITESDMEAIDWDDENLITEEEPSVIEKRMNICKQCSSLVRLKFCKECACFMPIKVRLKGARVKCPKGKW